MSIIARILGLMLAGQNLARSGPLIDRMMSGIAAIMGMATLCAILVSTLIVGALYGFYEVLLNHNVQPDSAVLIVAMVVVVMIGILVVALRMTIQRIKELPVQILQMQSPITSRAANIGQSFLNGLMNRTYEPRPRIIRMRAVK